MNKRQLIIILGALLYLPVFAYAGTTYLPVHHNVNRGEFASPVGVFNSQLGISSHGEFKTNGLFSKESMFKNTHSDELKSPPGIFNSRSNEFRSSNSILKTPKGEFKSTGLISREQDSMLTKGAFKSPDQGEFKFSLP